MIIIIVAGILIVTGLVWLFSKTPIWGLYAAIFASAILKTPELPIVREKFCITEIIMILTWVGILLKGGLARTDYMPLHNKQKAAIKEVQVFMFLILVSFCLGLIMLPRTVDFQFAFVRSAVETATYVYGFFLFLTTVKLIDSWNKWYGCIYSWILGAAVVSAVSVWAMTGSAPSWTMDEFSRRISSTLRECNQLPSFCLPIFTTTIFLSVMKGVTLKMRLAYLALIAGIIIAVFGTGSRMGVVMLAVSFIGMIFIMIGEYRHRRAYFSRPILFFIAIFIIIIMMKFIGTVISKKDIYASGRTSPYKRAIVLFANTQSGQEPLDENRKEQLAKGWEAFMERPLFGTGPGLFTDIEESAEIHNTYVGILAEDGIFSLVVFILWVYTVWRIGLYGMRHCSSGKERLFISSLLIGFITLLIYGVAYFSLRQRNLWFFFGIIVALPRLIRNNGTANDK